MRRKKAIRVAPSTTAASSSSPGTSRMNGRRITIVSGSPNAASGRATPSGLSSRPSLSSIRYSGSAAALIGNSSPTANSRNRPSRPEERVTGQGKRGHRAEHDDEDGRDRRDHGAVAQRQPERRRGKQLRVVVRDPGMRQPGGGAVDLRVALEAVDENEQQRYDGHAHQDQRGQVGDRGQRGDSAPQAGLDRGAGPGGAGTGRAGFTIVDTCITPPRGSGHRGCRGAARSAGTAARR